MKTYRIAEYKEAKASIAKYMSNKKEYAFIHYSCQSFYADMCENSPRIAAICVMPANSKQVYTFSLASRAELANIDLATATTAVLDTLEAEFLTEFYSFIKASKIRYWIHWKMKSNNYGFQAIAQRYCKVLKKKKTPYTIDDENKINLAVLLEKKYGPNYATRQHLVNILELNHIQPKHFLSGEQEAKAYDDKQYLSMERSTQAKVQAFYEILDRAGNDELKTQSRILRDIYGVSISGIATYVKENVVLAGISSIVGGFILEILYTFILQKIF